MIVNLSTTGALLHARTELCNKDDTVTVGFRIVLNGTQLALGLQSRVRSIFRKDSAAGNIHHGVEFSELSDNDRIALQAYVYWHLIERQAEG